MSKRRRNKHLVHTKARPVSVPGRSPYAYATLFVPALAFLLRLIVILTSQDVPLLATPQLDSLELLTWAREILRGDYVWPSPPTHGPVYPYVLAGFLRISGDSLLGARVCQALLAAASTALVMRLARTSFGQLASIFAGVLTATYAPLLYVETSLYEEGVFTFLLLLGLVFTETAGASLWRRLAAGVCLGLAIVARPTATLLLPLYAFAAIRSSNEPRRAVVHVTVLFAACLGVIAPVALKNWAVTGSPIIRTYGGLSLYMGNRPGSEGVAEARIGERWDVLQAEPLILGITNPAAQDKYFAAKLLREVRSNPVGWLQTLWLKTLRLLGATEIRESHSFHFFASQNTLLGLLPGFALLFPLAAVGLFWSVRTGSTPTLLSGYLFLLALGCVGLVVGLRYRIPLIPVLAVFAGHGAACLIGQFRQREWRRISAAVLIAIGALMLTLSKPHEPSLNFAEEWAFTGDALLRQRRFSDAEGAYRTSIVADPDRSLGWDGLGMVFLNLQQLDEAERAIRTALEKEPRSATARHHLGLVLMRRGDVSGAVGEFRGAIRLRPDDSEITSDLADALMTSGEAGEALNIYRDIERRGRPSSPLYVAIARAEGTLGRADRATEAAARAVALDPQQADAWFTLSVAQRATGDLENAEKSLVQATSLFRFESTDLSLAWAMLRRAQGRAAEAESILHKILLDEPASPRARALLLTYAAQDGRRDAAERFLRTLENKNP